MKDSLTQKRLSVKTSMWFQTAFVALLAGGYLAGSPAYAEMPQIVDGATERCVSGLMAGVNVIPDTQIVFYVTDFGINQWKSGLKTGDDFSHASNKVFPNMSRNGQVLIVMSPDHEFREMTREKLTQTIFNTIKSRIDEGLAAGNTIFEIQLVQNINTKGYFNPIRQKMVNDFGDSAYMAIGKVNDYIKSRGLHTHNYAICGSNGCKVLTENIQSWRSYLQGASMYDGRAFKTPTIDTIKTLKENIRFFNTAGDFAAPNNFFVHSIGNHDVSKELKKLFPGIQVTWLDPIDRLDLLFGTGHVAGMNSNSKFLAKDFTGDSYTTPQKMTAADLWPNPPHSSGRGGGVCLGYGDEVESFVKGLK